MRIHSVSTFLAALLLLATCLSGSVSALQVTGLYSHRIPVSNESDAERDRAFREALAAVIVKVTGDRRWLETAAVEQALQNAESYVEAISYAVETVPVVREASAEDPDEEAEQTTEQLDADQETEQPAPAQPLTRQQRYVEVDFSSRLIDRLLTNANIPVWNSNRPSVLVWMALQTPEGDRSLLTADINQDIIDSIQEFAARRGLPVIFPVLDFEDRRNLSEDMVWTLDEEAILRASARYDADSVLTGRLHFTASGELVGLWQFLFQDRAEVFDGFDTDLQAYLHAPLDRITTQLASYFAIVPEAEDIQSVRLQVDGVGDLQDYSSLIAYVSNLGLVQAVAPAAIDGERLELELDVLGDGRQLFELIALDRDLLPIESSQTGGEPVLHYRWTR